MKLTHRQVINTYQATKEEARETYNHCLIYRGDEYIVNKGILYDCSGNKCDWAIIEDEVVEVKIIYECDF